MTILNSFGQVALKRGVEAVGGGVSFSARLIATFQSPYLVAGGGLYLLSLLLYVQALSRTKLSLAYPFIGATYVLVVLLSIVVLGEPYDFKAVAGTLLIFLGVVLVGTGFSS